MSPSSIRTASSGSRPIEARLFSQAARNGVPFTTAFFAMDSANIIFQNVFARDGGFGRDTMGGAGDMLAIPDLSTFRVLPWAHKCGWVVSDLYLSSGERCPFDPRLIMQTACERLAQQGFTYIGGVEVECHILKITDPRNDLSDCTQPPTPPGVEALRHGYQYMSENVLDELEPIITRIRHALIGVGLPLRIVEAEWGPGSDRNIARSHGEHGSRGRRDHLAGSRQAGLPPHGPAGVLHDKACTSERVFEWLASSSVAVSHCEREECLRRSQAS